MGGSTKTAADIGVIFRRVLRLRERNTTSASNEKMRVTYMCTHPALSGIYAASRRMRRCRPSSVIHGTKVPRKVPAWRENIFMFCGSATNRHVSTVPAVFFSFALIFEWFPTSWTQIPGVLLQVCAALWICVSVVSLVLPVPPNAIAYCVMSDESLTNLFLITQTAPPLLPRRPSTSRSRPRAVSL